MSKKKSSRAPRERSTWFVIATWLSSVLSVGLLYLAGSAVDADLGSFRSCSSNTNGLSISNCGKQSLNVGDLVLFLLFALAACLTVALFTAAWRMSRRPAA